MPTPNNDLKDRLSRYRQIKISVIGRKSERTISIPVWFVLEGDRLYLLPVRGSDTQWYRNVIQNPSIRVDARGAEAEFMATPITHTESVAARAHRCDGRIRQSRKPPLGINAAECWLRASGAIA